jgi:CRISPR/Cas system CMR-associated protein Cmr1 (group 7 of RAMP superfamily)
MYTYLLRKADNYSVSFQDVDKTNILLKKYKMLDSMDVHTKDEVAKALGVDAVIFGSFEQQSTKSEAGAIATAVLFGGFGGKTGEGAMTIQIANGTDVELVWRYTKRMNEGLGVSTDDVVERQMRKLSRNFPYTK